MGCGTSISNFHGNSKHLPPPPPIREKLKLVWVGSKDSGLSTLVFRFHDKFAHKKKELERRQYIPIIRRHMIHNIVVLCKGMQRSTIPSRMLHDYDLICTTSIDAELSIELINAINNVWDEPIVKKEWLLHDSKKLAKNGDYFLNKLEKIVAVDYVPTTEDLLNCRMLSHGCIKHTCVVENREYQLYDGGDLFEGCSWDGKRKSLQFSQIFDAIVYVISLADYTEVHNDLITSQMISSLNKFQDLCKLNHWTKLPIILIFSKRDILSEKILGGGLREYPDFSDYCGTNQQSVPAVDYFQQKFIEEIKRFAFGQIYPHVSSAVDAHYDHVFKNIVLNCDEFTQLDGVMFSVPSY